MADNRSGFDGLKHLPKDITITEAKSLFLEHSQLAYKRVREAKDIEWLVDGILPRNSLIMCSGDPKLASKSLLAMHLALCVSNGTPFLGRHTEKSHVVYCNFEDGNVRVARRLRDYGVDPEKPAPGQAELWTVTDIGGLIPILKMAEQSNVGLVILDPFIMVAQFHGIDDENDPYQMRAILGYYSKLAQEYSLSILVNHHNTKYGSVMRGSSDIKGAVDGWWTIEPGKDNKKKLVVTLRDGEELQIGAQLHYRDDEGWTRYIPLDADTVEHIPKAGTPEAERSGQGRPPKTSDAEVKNRIVKCLQEHGCSMGIGRLAALVDASKDRTQAQLYRLEDEGLVAPKTDVRGRNRGYRWNSPSECPSECLDSTLSDLD